jgi:hypothetical protein
MIRRPNPTSFLTDGKLDDVRVLPLIRSRVRHIRTAGREIAKGVHLGINTGSLAMFAAIRAGFDQNQCERSVGRQDRPTGRGPVCFEVCRLFPSPTAAHEPANKCKAGLPMT